MRHIRGNYPKSGKHVKHVGIAAHEAVGYIAYINLLKIQFPSKLQSLSQVNFEACKTRIICSKNTELVEVART